VTFAGLLEVHAICAHSYMIMLHSSMMEFDLETMQDYHVRTRMKVQVNTKEAPKMGMSWY
jgi:hypothetical protein